MKEEKLGIVTFKGYPNNPFSLPITINKKFQKGSTEETSELQDIVKYIEEHYNLHLESGIPCIGEISLNSKEASNFLSGLSYKKFGITISITKLQELKNILEGISKFNFEED